MEGIPANYLGRIVSKENFRAFIYAPDGAKKLVNSWDEFEANMQTGLWFASIEEAQVIYAEPKLTIHPELQDVISKKTKAKKINSVND